MSLIGSFGEGIGLVPVVAAQRKGILQATAEFSQMHGMIQFRSSPITMFSFRLESMETSRSLATVTTK